MPWSLAADSFYDYTPTVNFGGSKTTRIYYVAEDGDNTTGAANDESKPFRTICRARKFTISAGNATRGARYTDASGAHYYVVDTVAGALSVLMIDNTPSTSPSGGTLTKASGTGDATLTYSASSQQDGALRKWNQDRGGSGGTVNLEYPDWILFRRGDTFERQSFETQVADGSSNMFGPDYTEPFVIGCYDPSITLTDSAWGAASSPTHAGTYCVPNPANSVLARPEFTNNPSASNDSWYSSVPGGGGVSANFGLRNGGNNLVIVGLAGSAGGGQTFAWGRQPVSFYRIEDCKMGTGYGVPLNSPHDVYRCVITGNGQPVEGNGPPTLYYDLNNLGYGFQLKECILDTSSADGAFSHTVYGGADADPYSGVDPGPIVFDGTIFSRSPLGDIQWRAGGTAYNNVSIDCASDMDAVGNTGNRTTTASYNVRIHGGAGPFAAGMNNMQYLSNSMNQGPVVIDNNIICHELSPTSVYAVRPPANPRSWTTQNNIFYKICQSGTNADVISTTAFHAGAIIAAETTITNAGSGYTDRTFNITDLTYTEGTITGSTKVRIVTVTLASLTGWPWQTGIHNREGWVVLGGFLNDGAGNDFTPLNGRICRVIVNTGDNTVQLSGDCPEVAGLTYTDFATHGGTLYLPYLGRVFTGGTGYGFRADVYVKGGQVVAIREGTDADNGNETMPNGQAGGGYAVNDSLTLPGATSQTFYSFEITSGTPVAGNTYTNNGQSFVHQYHGNGDTYYFFATGAPAASGTLAGTPTLTFSSASHLTGSDGSDLGTIPGGTGFALRVDAVASNTGAYNTNGNVTDISGSGLIGTDPVTYPHPERTVATYYNEVVLGAGIGAGAGGYTYDDFCDACILQSRQNWNNLLMAESLNDYIREGFGQAMRGSAYADSVGPVISITPSTLANGTVNVAYNQTVTASGGTAPYTYSVTLGSLPTGLSLAASTGIISGTPTVAATYAFTIQATDNAVVTGSQAYSVTIADVVVTPPATDGGASKGRGRGKTKKKSIRANDRLSEAEDELIARKIIELRRAKKQKPVTTEAMVEAISEPEDFNEDEDEYILFTLH